jgi:antitoxin component of MazEF toxin-antitoxin module
MKLPLRRIGNSLGVIVPKATLDAWGVGEGDTLELTEQGLPPDAARRQALESVARMRGCERASVVEAAHGHEKSEPVVDLFTRRPRTQEREEVVIHILRFR